MVKESIIQRIESLKEELAALQSLSEEAEDALWKKLRLEWNYNSNHIEGNTLTYGETKLLLMFEKTTGDHSKREYDEMEAHDAAVLMVQEWAQDKSRSLTESDIRELNKVILVKPFWKQAITPDGQSTRREIKIGEYKEHPNSVRLPNGEMFHYAKPEEVPIKMQELMDWYRSSSELDPVILAAELHYRFIRIHPFDDGNGRVARLLVNYVLMLNDLPPVVIKSAEKEKYLTALQKADVGDRDAFHSYMAEQLVWSLELSIKAAKGEDIEEEDDWKKKAQRLQRELKTKPKVILRSNEAVTNIITTTFTEFLESCSNELSTLSKLFWASSWHVHIDNSSPVDEYHMLRNNLSEPLHFDSLMSGLKEAAEGNSVSSFPITDVTIGYVLKQFNSDDDGFDISVLLSCVFENSSYYFVVEAYPRADYGALGNMLQDLSRGISRQFKSKEKVHLTFDKLKYHEAASSELLRRWSSTVGREVFNFIETEVEFLEKRRNRNIQ